MVERAVKIPPVVQHAAIVFLVAFLGQLVAGLSGAHIPSIVALITSAAVAGLTAVLHQGLGLLNDPKGGPQ